MNKNEQDDCYGPDGEPYKRGRCDTCGAPCDDDSGECTNDPSHEVTVS